MVFIAKLETAEEEFGQGRLAAFQAMAKRNDSAELGQCEIFKRHSHSEEISRMVGADFAYLVQTEIIRSRVAAQAELSNSGIAGYDGVSPRGRRLADCPSTRRFTDSYTAPQ